jgi:hypothetical protein
MDAATQREEPNRCVDGLQEVCRFPDYCPNALQAEARGGIRGGAIRGASAHSTGSTLIQIRHESGLRAGKVPG